MATYVDLVMREVNKFSNNTRTVIQSFDTETLNYMHQHYPTYKTVLLVENTHGVKQNLAQLNYTPWAYSPDFNLINKTMVDHLQSQDIKLIPWTVNEETDIMQVLKYGVYGIISDYPDRVIRIVEQD